MQATAQLDEWVAGAVLPNLFIKDPIEGDIAALVNKEDSRVKKLMLAHPNLKKFLNRFRNEFGEKLSPAMLLVRKNAPSSFMGTGALASFRDLISACVIPYGRAQSLIYKGGVRIYYSNIFWVYPWMLDKDYEHIIAQTPSLLALHDVSKFKGQCSPEISPAILSDSDVDSVLLKALIQRWQKRYKTDKPKWQDRALFRSLNMAYQASLMPAGADATLHDYGRSLCLWVSALEILAHPKKSDSGLLPVLGLFDLVAWKFQKSRQKKYKVLKKKNSKFRCLACWVYAKLYNVRNDFLHGNPVTNRTLELPNSKRNIFLYAGPLYRLALTGFLRLNWTKPIPPLGNGLALGKYTAENMMFIHYQEVLEKALHTSRTTEVQS